MSIPSEVLWYSLSMQVYYSDTFEIPLPPGHRFPMPKFRMLREQLTTHPQATQFRYAESPRAAVSDIERAHDAGYVAAVLAGTLDAAAQRRIGFPMSAAVVERARRAVGGTTATLSSALTDGAAVHLAGGTHHACRGHGEGYCVFNDVAVAALLARADGRIKRMLVVDLDVHQGNGTADIMQDHDWCYTFSMHAAKNYPFRKVAGDCDIELPDACGDDEYLSTLDAALEHVFAHARPDVVVYTSGADPHVDDTLGRLSLTTSGLVERDRAVYGRCREAGVPYAVTMAGGYGRDMAVTVGIHVNTVVAAASFV